MVWYLLKYNAPQELQFLWYFNKSLLAFSLPNLGREAAPTCRLSYLGAGLRSPRIAIVSLNLFENHEKMANVLELQLLK